MSKIPETDEAMTSSIDHGVGETKPVGLMSRLKGQKTDLNELGKAYFQQSLQYDEAQLARDAVKVRRKLDFYVLPLVRNTPAICFGAKTEICDIDDGYLYVELPGQTDVSRPIALPLMHI